MMMTTSAGSIVKKDRFVCVDLETNRNKFWEILLHDNNEVETRYGRVGESGQSTTKPFSSAGAAEAFYEKKIKEKESDRKGYTRQRTLENTGGEVKVAQVDNLKEIARKQIQADSVTQRLIDYLVKVNVHNITSSTKIEYNSATGFTTPLGAVTQDGIDEARQVLQQMGQFVVDKDWNNQNFVKLINTYMRIVPQDIGRGRPDPQSLYPGPSAIQKQDAILDSLEATLAAMLKKPDAPKKADEPEIFHVKLTHVENGTEIDRIRRKYRETLNRSHSCTHLDLKEVYYVEITGMAAAFERDGRLLSNIWELWHGTRAANLLSILKSGFVVPRSGGSIAVTGRMFGDGVYFSDQSTKSLNYAYGYWGGGGYDNNCFMFLNDVAMGNYHVPRSSFSGGCRPGYDSTYAKAGQSGVANNEMIVYRTSQVNPKYLCEFSPGGK